MQGTQFRATVPHTDALGTDMKYVLNGAIGQGHYRMQSGGSATENHNL